MCYIFLIVWAFEMKNSVKRTQILLFVAMFFFVIAGSSYTHIDDLPTTDLLPIYVSSGTSDRENPFIDDSDDLKALPISGFSSLFVLIPSFLEQSPCFLSSLPSLHCKTSVLRC